MIRAGLFRKYYLFIAMIVLVFIVAGFFASRLIIEQLTRPVGEIRSAMSNAKVIDIFTPTDRAQGLAQIVSTLPADYPFVFVLLDSDGRTLYPEGAEAPVDWATLAKPAKPYDVVAFEPKVERPPQEELIRFAGEPAQYLYVKRKAERVHRNFMSVPFLWTFGSFVVSVLLGIAFALSFLARSLRENAILADSILADLQRGNLKARFPIHVPKGRTLRTTDEISHFMERFNRMAEEIERLVEQLRGTEKSRTALLQDLAHDLRTPVASLKNLLFTLRSPMDQSLRDELQALAIKEAEYFERLVEDLLVLAQVGEPRYKASQKRVTLDLLVADEAENVAAKDIFKRKIRLRMNPSPEAVYVNGDEHLLRRMIRNALDNAFSFAQSEVAVDIQSGDKNVRILVSDDGGGFSSEALASFGDRRVSRVLGSVKEGENSRLSVGLGSVILKTIAEIHGGSVHPRNRSEGSRILGAEVQISLPATLPN